MKQLKEMLKIKILVAELDISSGEQSDGSKSSSELKSEVEKLSTATTSLKSNKSEDYAENMRIFATLRLVVVRKSS